jgi:hypothetical protein
MKGNNKNYVDLDSDYDLNESDTRESGTRMRTNITKELNFNTRAKLLPVRLQQVLNADGVLSGPFANLPILTDPSAFSLPPEWSCRHKSKVEEGSVETANFNEMEQLLELQRLVEEEEKSSVRRSARSTAADPQKTISTKRSDNQWEYYLPNECGLTIQDDDIFACDCFGTHVTRWRCYCS